MLIYSGIVTVKEAAELPDQMGKEIIFVSQLIKEHLNRYDYGRSNR